MSGPLGQGSALKNWFLRVTVLGNAISPLDQFAAYFFFFLLKQHILPFSVGNEDDLRTTKNHPEANCNS